MLNSMYTNVHQVNGGTRSFGLGFTAERIEETKAMTQASCFPISTNSHDGLQLLRRSRTPSPHVPRSLAQPRAGTETHGKRTRKTASSRSTKRHGDNLPIQY